FRVPLIVASPWSKGGWVNSEVCDHTSTLQFLENFLSHKTGKKVVEPNISDWRRTVCGDLASVFRPNDAKAGKLPAFVIRNNFLEGIHKAKFKGLPANFKLLSQQEVAEVNQHPHNSPHLPQQESGVKPSCALPYQLHADGKLNTAKTAFEITLRSGNELGNAAGSPFIVYAPGNYKSLDGDAFTPLRNWTYAVKPGDSLSDAWPINEFEDGHYHLRLYGPNGFYREFKGGHTEPEIETELNHQRNRLNKKLLTGNIELAINNGSKKTHTITLTDNAYKTGIQKKVVLGTGKSTFAVDLTKSLGWYDFTIRVEGVSGFEKRFAGRVETGKPGYTDPYMGRVV
ncbi:MAG: phospholipase domain-containing protein, partial [Bacteroidota bacterium]